MKKKKQRRELIWGILKELIMIMTGVFLALYVDNFRELKNERNRELALLRQLKNDLKSDLEYFNHRLQYSNGAEENINELMELIRKKSSDKSDLSLHFHNLFKVHDFQYNNSTYETLKSIGLDIIKNDSVRRSIVKLYEEKYGKMDRFSKVLQEEYLLTMNPIQQDFFKVGNNRIDSFSNQPYDLDIIRSNFKILNTFQDQANQHFFMNTEYEKLIKEVNSVIYIIEKQEKSRP